MTTKELIAAIEIGSSKIAGMVGRKDQNGNLEVLAYATENSSSFIRKGVIFNADKAVAGIKSIIDNLELAIEGMMISKVYICTCGQSFRSLKNVVNRDLKEVTKITDEIIDNICEENRAMKLSDLEIYDVIPQGYKIGTSHEMDPAGVMGNHIEGSFLNIVGRAIINKNLKRCFADVRIDIANADDPYITPLISAKYVLNESERRLGCALVDFGADTTTVSVYHKNILRSMTVIPIGGSSITHDLMSLNIDEEEAEELKVHYGSAILEQKTDEEEIIRLRDEDQTVKLSQINDIVEARAIEIIANVWNQIQLSGYANRLGSGIIFTGGGSNLRNLGNAFFKYIKRTLKLRTASQIYEPNVVGLTIPTDGTINGLIGTVLSGTENCCTRTNLPQSPTPPTAKKPEEEPIKAGETEDPLTVPEDDKTSEKSSGDGTSSNTGTTIKTSDGTKKGSRLGGFINKILGNNEEDDFSEERQERSEAFRKVDVIDRGAKEGDELRHQLEENAKKERDKAEREAQDEAQRKRKAEQKRQDEILKQQRQAADEERKKLKKEQDDKKREEERIKKEEERRIKEANKKDGVVKKTFGHLKEILFNDDPMDEQ